MQDTRNIQHAHDILCEVAIMDPPLTADDRIAAEIARDVLCWLCEHDHERFSARLENLEKALRGQAGGTILTDLLERGAMALEGHGRATS